MSSELTILAKGDPAPLPDQAVSNRTFRLVLYDALASEAMATLTTGVFLAGYAVELGASNAAIGMLAAVPFAVQFLQLPAVALVERLRKRRAIATWAAGFGRSLLIAAAAAPFLGSTGGHHRSHLVSRLVPGDGCHCRLRLELLDARSRPGK